MAGMVCTVAAASGEAYNGGFGDELARCTGGTDAAAPREGGELGVGGSWPGTEAHDAPHAARRLREGRGARADGSMVGGLRGCRSAGEDTLCGYRDW